MKFFLCTPSITGEIRYGKFKEAGSFLPPLGLCILGAVLEGAGHDVVLMDGQLPEYPHSAMLERIAGVAPDAVLISSVLISHSQAFELARQIKAAHPAIPVILGGAYVTTVKAEALNEPCVDYAVYGEGEVTVLELVELLRGERLPEEILGLIWRKDGAVGVNPPRPFIKDLDTVPLPARHLLPDIKRYSTHILAHRRRPMTSMITSRGCTGHCTFCNRIFGNEYRFHSAEYVLREIDSLVATYGIREIEIEDDTFTVDRQRVVDICNGLIGRGQRLIWSCASRVTTLDLELLKLMRKAGCWMVQIGIETGDEAVLKSIKKAISLERVRKVVEWACQAGVEVKGFFMIGHHTDTAESIEKTIAFANSLKIHTANFAIGNPYPGTEFFELAPKHGTFTYDPDRYSAHTGEPLFVPHGLTGRQLEQYKNRAYRTFYSHPYRIFKFLGEIRSLDDIKRFSTGFKIFLRLLK